MASPDPNFSLSSTEPLISEADRKRITSGWRLTIALMAMAVLIVAALTALIFNSVARITDSMTPAVARDLEWKALRGAVELSKTAEVGLVVRERAMVEKAASDYLRDTDVVNVVAMSADGSVIFQHGPEAELVKAVFAKQPKQVHRSDKRLMAWAPAVIEWDEVGKVAVAISTSRLEAGYELRRQVLNGALLGGLAALLLALGFVVLYIWPVLRLTQAAFVRLERTTAMALEAARLKAQFLANMSHEIRTPMNAVVGLVRLMLDMPLGPKLRRYAEMIDASSRSLLSIINDILDFSKIEAGKYEIVRGPCEPMVLVQEVAELLAERAQGKGVDLVYRIDPKVPYTIEADTDRVRQVLTNLVGNAVKFTERGEVFIQVLAQTASDDNVTLRIEVRDSGVGVPEQLREHIFESFSQADGSLIRKHGGTGLGLAISKQLTILMGGEIGLESEVGKGSCFWFTLPAKILDKSSAVRAQPSSLGKRALIVCDNAHAAQGIEEHMTAWGMDALVAPAPEQAAETLRAAGQSAPLDIVVICETQSGGRSGSAIASIVRAGLGASCPPIVLLTQLHGKITRGELDAEISAQLAQPVRMSELYECLARLLTGGTTRATSAKARGPMRNFHGAKVLVVDDNEMNQFVAAEQLTRLGCIVDQAMNGQEAVDAVLSKSYALVLMDCQMPVMDGYTATREIRAREPAGQRNIIVALTAHALQGERERVLSAGMDDYLTKPVRPQLLQRTLERWIAGTGARDAGPEDGADPQQVSGKSDQAPANDQLETLEGCATELLKMFLDKVPGQLELLDGALAAGEADEVRAHAHKLKGSLLTLGARSLAELAQQLQHEAENGDISGGDAVFQQLMSGYGELETRVKQEVAARARAAQGVAHG